MKTNKAIKVQIVNKAGEKRFDRTCKTLEEAQAIAFIMSKGLAKGFNVIVKYGRQVCVGPMQVHKLIQQNS